MAELDPYDRLLEACKNAKRYPSGYTLLKKTTSRAVLDEYYNYLLLNDSVLFARFHKTMVGCTEELDEHLIREEKDPKCRHIFIESENSRAPLNCSSHMLRTLLTYHQVDPSFLESLFTFGDQDEPLDAGLSHFQSDDALVIQERLPFLESLGRSGRELRHSFLLRSVERAPGAAEPWSIRQVAAYHSFDVVNGRTVWIIVKGNDSLQKMIMQDTDELPVQRRAIQGNVEASFEASLATHLIFFRWCEQNWRWFVRDMEERIRKSLVRAKTIPVESEPHFVPLQHKTGTGFSTFSKSSVLENPVLDALYEKRDIPYATTASGPSFPTRFEPSQVPAWQPQGPPSSTRQVPEGMLVLNMFNYKELQTLSKLVERLEEVILIIQLDVGVLKDVQQYYLSLARSDEIGDNLKRSIEKSVSTFLVRLRHIIRSLETRHSQLVSLRKRLDEGKTLYENLLQLRSLQVSRIFAEHGHKSSMTMESIARKTQRETVSMHTITVVTLVFLPATFLATFFQSGVLQWKETPEIIDGWLFRADVFKLFIAICVPMTILTFLGWLLVNVHAKIKLPRKHPKDNTSSGNMARGQSQGLPV